MPDECWTLDVYRHGAWLGGWVRPRVDLIELDDDDDEALELAEEPPLSVLAPLLPPGAELEGVQARLLPEDDDEEAELSPDEVLECLCAELCLLDYDWDPAADADLLAEGEYGEEDMPVGWTEFVLLPTPELPLLDTDWDDDE